MFSRLIPSIFSRLVSCARRLGLSALSGLILYLSWPPNTWSTFLIFIALVPLLIVELDIARKKISCFTYFGYAYFSFFIFNLCTTFWVSHAHAGGAVFAILCNSFFMALVFVCYATIKNSVSWKNTSFLLPVLWIGFEYLHLNWDLSWPWLTLGNVFASHPGWVQWYSYTGVLGGSLWVLVVNLMFLEIYKDKFLLKRKFSYVIYIFCIILFPFLVSFIVMQMGGNAINSSNKSINVMIVQPNIHPDDKFAENPRDQQLAQRVQLHNIMNLVNNSIDDSTNFIIFPETFISNKICVSDTGCSPGLRMAYRNHTNTKYQFKNLIKNTSFNLNIIVGAPLLEQSRKSAESKLYGGKWYNNYNAALHYDKSKLDIYRKSKLVPGAEQIPFQNFLHPLLGDQALQIGNAIPTSFATQDSVTVFSSIEGYNIAPIICYESIYGDYVRQFVKKGAEAIFVITNDSWWGETDGYKQHNMYAQLRAIETRKYIVRSANTGISSIINPQGEIENKINWDVRDIMKQKIQLNNKITFYVKHGDFLGRLSAFLSVIVVLYYIVFILINKLIFSRK